MKWGAEDFAFASALVIGVGVTYELAARMTGSRAYRAAVGVALATAFMLVWINAAVGIIGSEDNPANLMYWGVLATGIVGAIVGRFRPDRMARAMAATAFAQVLAGMIALIAGGGSPGSGPWEILGLTCFFAAPWLISAWLFRNAAGAGFRASSAVVSRSGAGHDLGSESVAISRVTPAADDTCLAATAHVLNVNIGNTRNPSEIRWIDWAGVSVTAAL